MSEVYCLGATVIAKNKKVAEKFEREYYESRGEKYIPHAFTKVDKKGGFKIIDETQLDKQKVKDAINRRIKNNSKRIDSKDFKLPYSKAKERNYALICLKKELRLD